MEGEEKNRHRETIHSILVIAIGIFALIGSAAGFFISVNNPFADILKQGAAADELAAKRQQAELLVMQTKDTDGDGLTDYDEINKYQTSPYLADSDSDGVDDKTEVMRGTNPNCPEGQQCFNVAPAASATSPLDNTTPTLTSNTQSTGLSITPAYIRNLMTQNGVSAADLAQVTDEELMTEFQQFLKDNPDLASSLSQQGVDVTALSQASVTQPAVGSNPQPNVAAVDLKSLNVTSVSDLKNLTGVQIRQLMIQSGASESLLSAVSDDDLKAMFIKQIDSQTTTK